MARVFLTGRRVKYTKTRQTRITFDTQLKIAPVGFLDFYNDIYEV